MTQRFDMIVPKAERARVFKIKRHARSLHMLRPLKLRDHP